jgi:hypothetical protein
MKAAGWMVVVLILVIFGTGYANDHASCTRHNVLVPAIHQYPIDAAIAREQSARLELARGPRWNPAQAEVDLLAARRFRADAARTMPLDCSGPLPATH